MPNVFHQPHDKLFKLSMGELPVAKEFFETHLPTRLLKKIDLNTLKLQKQSFVDGGYKSTEADIVYSVQMGDTITYLYILCEHQNKVDQHIAFRLLIYTVRIMEMHHKQYPNQPLPLVYPMVIYTGEPPWDAPLDIFPLFGAQQALAKEWFLKPYQLLDVCRVSDDDLRQHPWYGLVAFALKHQKTPDFNTFLEWLLPWIQELERQDPQGVSLGKVVLQYVLNGVGADNAELFVKKAHEYLSNELRGEAMTLAQAFEQRGFEKGKQEATTLAQAFEQRGFEKGIQQGRQQGEQQGMQQGEIALMIRQLKRRFIQIPPNYLQRLEQADAQTLLRWGEKILDARTLDDVFAEG